jgi:hypothetical protein
MSFWDNITKDLQKEFKAGMAFIKESTSVMKKKAKKASKEMQRHFKLLELKTKVQDQMAGLGGRIYELRTKTANPMKDKKVISIMNRIRKLEVQIGKLEKQAKSAVRKKTAKKTKTQKATSRG